MAQAKGSKGKGKTETPAVQAPPPANLPEGVTIKRRITLPSLAIKTPGDSRVLKLLDAMRVSKVETKADSEGKKREPATICTAADAKTGEQFIFIVPAVVKSNLMRDYPDDSYVGLTFWIENKGKRTPNQRYNDFSISEVEVTQ